MEGEEGENMYRKSERKIARLELLDELDQEQITALQRLAFSRNSEIRARAAVLLALWCDERTEEILYHLTFDRDEVVRLEAIDSLSAGRSMMSLQRLEQLCRHDDGYVRFFALQSHYDVYRKICGESEESKESYLRYLRGLGPEEDGTLPALAVKKLQYLCGSREGLTEIIKALSEALKTGNYSLVSPALNILVEIVEPFSSFAQEVKEALLPFSDRLDQDQYAQAVAMIGSLPQGAAPA